MMSVSRIIENKKALTRNLKGLCELSRPISKAIRISMPEVLIELVKGFLWEILDRLLNRLKGYSSLLFEELCTGLGIQRKPAFLVFS